MRKISILLLLLFAVFSTQAQVSVTIDRNEHGFTQTKQITTTCVIHNEGDSLVVIMDSNYITGNDLDVFVSMIERKDYMEAINILEEDFAYEIIEYDHHHVVLRKTIVETYQVDYASELPNY